MAFDAPSQALHDDQMQSQQDEGYSGDTQSIAGDDGDATRTMKPLSDAAQMLLHSLGSLSLDDRMGLLRCATALFKDILFPLPIWAKQDVSAHLDSLMYFDPIRYFPYEIVQDIFSHLNPKELLNASAVDQSKIRSVEQSARERAERYGFGRRDSKKRRLAEAFNEADPILKDYDLMEGIETSFSSSPQTHRLGRQPSFESVNSVDSTGAALLDNSFRLKPPIMQARMGDSDGPKVSWAWMYKQRRLLERNWDQGVYKHFRLPHPKYESEGHLECVYTIQHMGSTLVSGSRDRTIRRWDLETCRLMGPPLHGHDASVLCLQFDSSPQHDIIVSGGSDSWVIIWKFSTGEIIKKMTTAHSESVLNLRFDDRYIVTCSKDKTIKIWNRRAIKVSDPLIPEHTLSQYSDPDLLIPEFNLLARLNGHQAAVNAVMIHEDRIVSASGDRVIKAWSIRTGKCEKTYTGHTKGIACVQYDGRRIVSGSSDNTVRIFDAEQQAEVACLQGHSNLVRTVQARFGDLEVMSDQELHEQARRADLQWSKAMAIGAQPASGSRRSTRNAGSSRPEDMLAIGAKVPPGGGGTRWAKIVSGSYDETVIIWRKDHDGKWTARHKLHQDMLSRHRVRIHRPQPPPGQPMPGAFPPQNVLDAPIATPSSSAVTTSAPSNAAVAPSTSTQITTTTTTHREDTIQPAATGSQAQRPAPRQTAAAAAMNPPQTMQQLGPAQRESNRVFKLQFDTRRIVCCSQNKVIVGWDFSNGNEDLARVGTWCEETY
ncbi:hypothetical protein AMS68_004227 [Peltaster fructicola]|uniref:F-box domain-containing protein n=1 Tax=Peltaster fructicola TaxID=286661 RepID=A0A6H0XW83_9PEZI|nr:hypothetical protein AMS68_004227 [Peltaster fructicola]